MGVYRHPMRISNLVKIKVVLIGQIVWFLSRIEKDSIVPSYFDLLYIFQSKNIYLGTVSVEFAKSEHPKIVFNE